MNQAVHQYVRQPARVRGRRCQPWGQAPALAMLLIAGLLLSACSTPAPGGFAMPEVIVADDGVLATDLYVQFAQAKVSGATRIAA